MIIKLNGNITLSLEKYKMFQEIINTFWKEKIYKGKCFVCGNYSNRMFCSVLNWKTGSNKYSKLADRLQMKLNLPDNTKLRVCDNCYMCDQDEANIKIQRAYLLL